MKPPPSFVYRKIYKWTCSLNEGFIFFASETTHLLLQSRSATSPHFWIAECWHLGKTWQLCFLPMGGGLLSVGFGTQISSRTPCHTSFPELTQPHLITINEHLATKTQPKRPMAKPKSQDPQIHFKVTFFCSHKNPEFYANLRLSKAPIRFQACTWIGIRKFPEKVGSQDLPQIHPCRLT